MKQKNFNFISYLKTAAKTEEDVKFAYVKKFNIPFSTKHKNDCRTDNTLFEFKYNKNLSNEKKFAEVLAQSFYYIYRAKYGPVEDIIPSYIILADIDEVIIIPINKVNVFYSDPSFDWDRVRINSGLKSMNMDF